VASTGADSRWRVVDGVDRPPVLCERFLEEWCLEFPRLETQKEWAELNGVTPRTLNNWLRDTRFLRLWRERSDASFASPEYTSPMIAEAARIAANVPGPDGERMYTATEQLKAMDTYGRFVNMTSPKQVEHRIVPVSKTLADMSLDELTSIAAGVVDVGSELVGDGEDEFEVCE
jgi:hypothetical protein